MLRDDDRICDNLDDPESFQNGLRLTDCKIAWLPRANLPRTGQEQELTKFLRETFPEAELADVLNQLRQAEVHSVEELKALTQREKEFDNKIPNDTLRTRLQNLSRPGMCHSFL